VRGIVSTSTVVEDVIDFVDSLVQGAGVFAEVTPATTLAPQHLREERPLHLAQALRK